MLYIVKFLYSFLLPPGFFILLLLLYMVYLWRRKKGVLLVGLLTLILYVSSVPITGDFLLRSLEASYPSTDMPQGDIIVMLGGGATSGTPNLDGEGNLSGDAANRLLASVQLHRKLQVPILVSGGRVFADSGEEALIAKRVLLQLGVEENQIIVETNSLNTEGNALFTKELLQKQGFTRPILVTSAYHMKRSVLNFHKQGIAVIPFPADYHVSGETGFYLKNFVPSARSMLDIAVALKEYMGIAALKIL